MIFRLNLIKRNAAANIRLGKMREANNVLQHLVLCAMSGSGGRYFIERLTLT